MKRLAMAALLALQLAGCTAHASRCPLLPEPPERPTAQQLDAYTAQLVRLYGQCAGDTP